MPINEGKLYSKHENFWDFAVSPVERFHSTLRTLTLENDPISLVDNMTNAATGYNHLLHSVIKFRAIDIQCDTKTQDPFDLDLIKFLSIFILKNYKDKT